MAEGAEAAMAEAAMDSGAVRASSPVHPGRIGAAERDFCHYCVVPVRIRVDSQPEVCLRSKGVLFNSRKK